MEVNAKVTVVIATYNRPQLLKRALESVFAQGFQDFEIVVVDDGLKERAESVAGEFNDSRIRYIQHERNRGCSAAKNTGIRAAKGGYIAILDDDDAWLPEKLEVQVRALEGTSPDVGFSFHAAIEVFDDREYVTTVPEGEADYLDFALRTFSGMIDSSMMYKRDVFEKTGYLNESYPTHTGAEFIIRVSKHFKGVGINTPLVRREMKSGHAQMGSNIGKRVRGRIMLLEEYKEEFLARPRFFAKHLTQLGIFYRTNREYGRAFMSFVKALRYHFSLKRVLHALSMVPYGIPYRFFKKIS